MWYRLGLLWTLLILVTGLLPLSNFDGIPHWGNLRLYPRLEDLRYRRFFLDIALNIWLYMPFGFCYLRDAYLTGKSYRFRVLGYAALLSLGIETFQLFCDTRFSSAIDVFDNILGAFLGMVVAAYLRKQWPTLRAITPTPSDRTLAP